MFDFKKVKNKYDIPKAWPNREPDLLINYGDFDDIPLDSEEFIRVFWIDECLQSNFWSRCSNDGTYDFEERVYDFDFINGEIKWRDKNDDEEDWRRYDKNHDIDLTNMVSNFIVERTILSNEEN